ncbi:tRNA preQ1(34) S-adenosylmethionine ribosyltransferase-isomerase QueA [Pelagibius sp. Alg239-R121]|uniref:tRNA preQ1(34) S-adenosylmethionine ribosyltransferase-isomerase QueA n=1 Tax=Pelagibius sp. Alg239-R121 TaxID=2993448 RepID=UPI0024A65F28|nr:tRNA preQ1(34) S-adenosylmethionine ribosyltransferase-isomerase QueA [Pelagibius sp. Alg239-R121]
MKTDLFDFDLPRELIAQHPASPRHAARLLSVGDSLGDHSMAALPELLSPGDILVFNDTRVIPARLTGRRGMAKIEVTLHKRDGGNPADAAGDLDAGAPAQWRVFARPARKLRLGERVDFAEDFSAEVMAKGDAGEVTLKFNTEGPELLERLHRHGIMPLPPYIQREAAGEQQDSDDYQTIFAVHHGAVAAPTAGLHYTPELLAALDARGLKRTTVTLHVGAGTFLPVKVDDTRDHKMHGETGVITAETAETINAAKAAGGRVIAVGTTALRLLESAADKEGMLHPFAADTDIFITPGYRFRIVDLLLTNFHLPRSTLFMLVSAFAGLERMQAAYAHAKASGYRFYSYGDCSLLQRAAPEGIAARDD